MPHKHNKCKRHHIKKAVYRLRNYAQYNQSLKNRGKFSLWLSSSIIENWQYDMRDYDVTGSTVKYPDSTIEACHYIKMVFKLPLRQAQGFIEDLLVLLGKPHLQCPDYTLLSKRLSTLGLITPRFKNCEGISDDIVVIAIDSTGLKPFERGEWHQDKHKVDGKRTWMKAHFAVGINHIIEAAVMTGKDEMDDQVVGALCEQITADVGHVTADKMYDTNAVYQVLDSHSPNAEIVIPPKDNTFADNRHHSKRRSNLIECAAVGIMRWQNGGIMADEMYREPRCRGTKK